eukprot:m51a1_g11473 hypothetical protein (312) ;mRNA; f:9200-11853
MADPGPKMPFSLACKGYGAAPPIMDSAAVARMGSNVTPNPNKSSMVRLLGRCSFAKLADALQAVVSLVAQRDTVGGSFVFFIDDLNCSAEEFLEINFSITDLFAQLLAAFNRDQKKFKWHVLRPLCSTFTGMNLHHFLTHSCPGIAEGKCLVLDEGEYFISSGSSFPILLKQISTDIIEVFTKLGRCVATRGNRTAEGAWIHFEGQWFHCAQPVLNTLNQEFNARQMRPRKMEGDSQSTTELAKDKDDPKVAKDPVKIVVGHGAQVVVMGREAVASLTTEEGLRSLQEISKETGDDLSGLAYFFGSSLLLF